MDIPNTIPEAWSFPATIRLSKAINVIAARDGAGDLVLIFNDRYSVEALANEARGLLRDLRGAA